MLNIINSILSISFKDKEGNKYNTNDILLKYKNNPNAFLSFTEEDKLGINPNSKYDTPLGIYCYPIKNAYEYYKRWKDEDIIGSLPFATDKKYFNIFKTKTFDNIITDSYNEQQLENDFNKLKKIYFNTKILKISFHNFINKYNNDSNIPYNKIDKPLARIFYLTYHIANKNPIKWNKIFRELGYEGFIDPGYGIIHKNEPCQAVFFSIKNIEVIERYKNYTKDITRNFYFRRNIIIDGEIKEKFKFLKSNIIIKNNGILNESNINESNINLKESFIKYSEIKNSKISGNGEIYDSPISYSILNNINITTCRIEESNINNSILDDCLIKKCEINNSKLIDKNNRSATTISDSKINNCNINNKRLDIRASFFNNCNINNCDIFIYNPSIIIKFNNVKINGLDLSTLNKDNIKDINIPIFSHFEEKTINIKDALKDKKLSNKVYKCFEKFINHNYPNLKFLYE